MQGVHCNLHTGQERQVLAGAQHVSCTIEMASTTRQWDCAVIDEIQVGFATTICKHDICVMSCHMLLVCALPRTAQGAATCTGCIVE